MTLGILFCTVLVQTQSIKDTVVYKIIFVMEFPMNLSESSRGGTRGGERYETNSNL